jgi:acyl carrier protein
MADELPFDVWYYAELQMRRDIVSVEANIFQILTEVAKDQCKALTSLSNAIDLLDTGLDSLCFAIIVARLEDQLGIDPFSTDGEFDFPVTVGDFIRLYEHAAASAGK